MFKDSRGCLRLRSTPKRRGRLPTRVCVYVIAVHRSRHYGRLYCNRRVGVPLFGLRGAHSKTNDGEITTFPVFCMEIKINHRQLTTINYAVTNRGFFESRSMFTGKRHVIRCNIVFFYATQTIGGTHTWVCTPHVPPNDMFSSAEHSDVFDPRNVIPSIASNLPPNRPFSIRFLLDPCVPGGVF